MSVILAKIFGLYIVAIGLAFLLHPQRFKNLYGQIIKDENFLFLGGILALLIGSVIITLHNQWIMNWTVIISLLGWWSFIKGFTIIAYPDTVRLFSFIENRSNLFYRIFSLAYIILGTFLIYKALNG